MEDAKFALRAEQEEPQCLALRADDLALRADERNRYCRCRTIQKQIFFCVPISARAMPTSYSQACGWKANGAECMPLEN